MSSLKKKPALLWGSVGGAVLLLALIIFAFTRGGRGRVTVETREALPVATPESIPAAIQAGAPPGTEMPRLPALMPSRTEVLLTQLQESGKNNPEAWANILRSWLAEGDAIS